MNGFESLDNLREDIDELIQERDYWKSQANIVNDGTQYRAALVNKLQALGHDIDTIPPDASFNWLLECLIGKYQSLVTAMKCERDEQRDQASYYQGKSDVLKARCDALETLRRTTPDGT